LQLWLISPIFINLARSFKHPFVFCAFLYSVYEGKGVDVRVIFVFQTDAGTLRELFVEFLRSGKSSDLAKPKELRSKTQANVTVNLNLTWSLVSVMVNTSEHLGGRFSYELNLGLTSTHD
jgi:hypothetical protein